MTDEKAAPIPERIAAIFLDGFDSTNQQQAEYLFSIYLKHGKDQAVFDYCQAHNLPGTKPPIAKMRRNFDWEKQREKIIKSQFAASPGTGDMLVDSFVEIENQITILKKQMKSAPGNMDVHRAFGSALAIKLKIATAIKNSEQKDKTVKALDNAKKQGGLSDEAAEELTNKILMGQS